MTGPKKRRAAGATPILVTLEPRSGVPLHRQIYEAIREGVLAGRLAPGARVPSTRALAGDLGVARNTVATAYDQLRVEGYLVGRRGGGTRVRRSLPDRLLNVAAHARTARVARAGVSAPPAKAARGWGETEEVLSVRGAMLAAAGATFMAPEGTPPVPFQFGAPAADAFPRRLWARLSARYWRRSDVRLGAPDSAGAPALREAIASYVSSARGARCTAEHVLVVNGAQQALDLVARALLDRGDSVWIEEPGYIGARVAFAAAGAQLVPVRVDGEGLDVAAGERACPGARMAYVTPSHQFPLGAVMSATRRLALLAWALRTGAWIVEDDYDSEFRYAGRPLACLQGLEAERRQPSDRARVLYVGTFTKTLAPGFRLGYLVVPDELIDGMRAVRAAVDRHSPVLAQDVLAEFIGEGHYARHLRRVRALYAERQAVLLDVAAAELGGLVTVAADPAGLHLVGWLADGVRDADAAESAAAAGVNVVPLSRSYLRPGSREAARAALLLGYAAFDAGQIVDGVRRLRGALKR